MFGNFPKYIEIQTFSKCNAYCKICPYAITTFKENYRMEFDKIKALINEISENVENVARVIPYMNNEPFLDDRMIEILRYIKSKNLYVEISTNASCLTKTISETIIKEKLVDDFRISIFSAFENKYKDIMPGLNFKSVYKNIKFLIDINNKYNNPVDITLIQVMHEKIELEKEQIELMRLFPNTKTHCFGYLDRAGALPVKNIKLSDSNPVTLRGCSLERLESRFTIKANGDVIICSQDWKNDEIIGDVNENTIKDIWKSNKRKELLRKLYGLSETKNDFICKRCKLANVSNTENLTLNFLGDEFMTENDKKKFIDNDEETFKVK